MRQHEPVDRLDYYRSLLANRSLPDVGVCLTWCTGVDLDEVVARLGADGTTTQEMTVWEASGVDDPPGRVLVGRARDCVMVTEPSGVLGAMPDMLKQLSRGGAQAVNVFWNGIRQGPLGTRLIDGREPDPAHPGDFVATRAYVESIGTRIGDRFDLALLT